MSRVPLVAPDHVDRAARRGRIHPLARATAGVALAAALAAALIGGSVAQASTPVTLGYRDFGYGGALASRPTSDPEQSKLWYNDGAWWGGLFVSSGSGSGGSHFDIFKYIPATHSWQDTTRQVDIRDLSHADYLWDGGSNKLYVASSKSICEIAPAPPSQPCNDQIRVYRYTYNSAATTLALKYTLDTGFPKVLAGGQFASGGNFTGGGSNAVTIAKDSSGELWVAYTRDDPTTAKPPIVHFNSNVYLASSVNDGATWSGPTKFAGSSTAELDQDNTASVIALGGGKVGLYWTEKHAAGASNAFFATHTDGDPDGTWAANETVTTGTNSAQNQANLKADSAGKVYAVIKTGVADQIRLFDRSTGGAWTSHNVSTAGNGNTRAQVVLDEELGLAYVFSSSGSTTAGTIYAKSAPLSTLDFPAGKGAAFIQSATDHAIDDISLTKQTVTGATDIVAQAADRVTFQLLHGEMALSATDATAPAGTVAINGGALIVPRDVTLSVPATDAGSGVQYVRVSNGNNNVDGNNMLTDASALSVSWGPTVPWTLSAGDGSKTIYVQFRDGAGNWSNPLTATTTMDGTAPVGNVSIDAGAAFATSTAVTLDVTATDAGVGVVSNVRIANAGTNVGGVLSDSSAITFPYSASVPWTLLAGADGVRSVYAQWQDSLGNWSGIDNDTITLDTMAPDAGTMSIVEPGPVTSPTIHLTLTNPGAATRVRVAESLAGLTSATPVAYGTPLTYSLLPGLDGTRTVYVEWLDDAGNASAAVSDTIVVDLRHPVGTVAINGPSYTGVHSLAVNLYFPSTDTDIDQITISNSPTMAGAITKAVTAPFTGAIPWILPGPLTNRVVKHVYVTFHDQAGNTSDVVSGQVYSATDSAVVDLTKPVLHSPVTARWATPSTLIGTAIPLRLTWPAATDTITGVGSYRVLVSRDGGAYLVIGAPTTATFTTLVSASHTYRFRVYAVDRAANTSLSVYTATMRTIAYQDNSASVHFSGSWGTSASPSFYGGTARYSNTRTASASLTFSGRSVSWMAALGPTRGQARVYVDGTLISTINLNSLSTTERRLVFARTWSSVGTHVIKVVVLGTAGHPRVDVDTFLVLR